MNKTQTKKIESARKHSQQMAKLVAESGNLGLESHINLKFEDGHEERWKVLVEQVPN